MPVNEELQRLINQRNEEGILALMQNSNQVLSREDLEAALQSIRDPQKKEQAASAWISSENRSREDLKKLCDKFGSFSTKSLFAFHWAGQPNRSQEDLVFAQKYYSGTILNLGYGISKNEIARNWASQPDRTREDLQFAFGFISENRQKVEIANNWVRRPNRNLQDLEFAFGFISDNYKSEIINNLVRHPNRTLKDLEFAFRFITNNRYKSEVISNLVRHPNRTPQDLKFAFRFISEDWEKSEIANNWVNQTERNQQDLQNLFDAFGNWSNQSSEKSFFAIAWANQPNRTLQDLKFAFGFISSGLQKDEIARNWANQPNRTPQDLKFAFGFFSSDWQKDEIANNWAKQTERNQQDLQNLCDAFGDSPNKYFFVSSWASQPNRTQEDLVFAFRFISENRQKVEIANKWANHPHRTLQDLEFAFGFISENRQKVEITNKWANHPNRTLQDLKFAFRFNLGDWEKSVIAYNWAKQTERNQQDLQNLCDAFGDSPDKSFFVSAWAPQPNRTQEDLVFAFRFISENRQKVEIANKWANHPHRTLQDLEFAFGFISENRQKVEIANKWADHPHRTPEDLEFAFGFISENRQKVEIAEKWANHPNRTLQDLKFAFRFNLGDRKKSVIAYNWVDHPNRTLQDLEFAFGFIYQNLEKSRVANNWVRHPNRTPQDLKFALDFITDSKEKSSLAINWLEKSPPETKKENFLDFAKRGIFLSPYNIEEITSVYLRCQLPIEDFPNLGKELYPNNENLQSETFKEFVRRLDTGVLSQNKEAIKSFISSLNDDNEALEALNAVKTKANLTKLEILEIADLRVSNKYQSIAETLKTRNANDSLTIEGLILLTDEFGQIPENLNLAGVLSYYDVAFGSSGLAIFKSILRPEVFQELRRDFAPSKTEVFVLPNEFQKLAAIFNDQANPQLNLEMPRVAVLSYYLSTKVGNTNLSKGEIQGYRFGESEILEVFKSQSASKEKTKLEHLTEKFVTLLKSSPADSAKFSEFVAEFFEEALHLDGRINPTQNKALTDFFNRDKFLLAKLLQQEGGFDKFSRNFYSIADGCFANIGTGVRVSVYSSLIADPCDQILFSVFNEKLLTPILNATGGVDHFAERIDARAIFTTDRVNNSHISITGLVEAVKNEFFKNGKKTRDALKFIDSEMPEIKPQISALIEERSETTVASLRQELEEFIKTIPTDPIAEINKKMINPETSKEERDSLRSQKSELSNMAKEDAKADQLKIEIGLMTKKADLMRTKIEQTKYEKTEESAAKFATYQILKKTVPQILESKYLREFKQENESLMNQALANIEQNKPSPSPKSSPRSTDKFTEIRQGRNIIS